MAEAVPQSFRRPLLALILLSPVIAEMLSGSAPPVEWLLPTTPLLLIWLYGSGVLVMRETAVRWNLGWAGAHVLAAVLAVAFLVWFAKTHADRLWLKLPAGAPPRPAAYAVAGFSFFGGSFILYAGGPYLGGHPAVTFLE